MAAGLLDAPAAAAPPGQVPPGPGGAPAAAGPEANPLPVPLGVATGILVDAANGKVLWQENDTVPRAPASLTKLVTAMVVLSRANLDATAPVTPDAVAVGGSEVEAPAGTAMTIRDMLWGLLLVSGNDMAVALAHAVGGDGSQGSQGMANFVGLMNTDAAAVGATGSHFANPDGLDDPGHVATARDLALVSLLDLRNPMFAQMVGAVTHTLAWDGQEHVLSNHNKLLTMYPGTIGIKTGYTSQAGWDLASAVTRKGVTLLAVVMGTRSPAGYDDSEALYNWGFANLAAIEARSTDTLSPKPLPFVAHPAAAAAAGRAAPDATDVPAGHRLSVDGVLIALLAASFALAAVLTRRDGAQPPA